MLGEYSTRNKQSLYILIESRTYTVLKQYEILDFGL
jgi:hypothetical protein